MDDSPANESGKLPSQDGGKEEKEVPSVPAGYQCWEDVVAHALAVVQSRGIPLEVAEDLAEEAMVKLIRSYWDRDNQQWRVKECSAKGLVSTIAFNAFRDHLRKKQKWKKVFSDCAVELAVSPEVSSLNELEVMEQLIQEADLSEDERTVIRGTYMTVPKLNYAQLGELLGRTPKAIHGLLVRGKAKLFRFLERRMKGMGISPAKKLKLAADTSKKKPK